jgi:hypothetical protein
MTPRMHLLLKEKVEAAGAVAAAVAVLGIAVAEEAPPHVAAL